MDEFLTKENYDLLNVETERRKIFEPLRFFKPNRAQAKFFEAINDSSKQIILFPAGNWVGKTASAVAALAACCWPSQAENFAIYWKFPKRARIVSTPKELENIGSVQSEIKKWFPPGRYTSDKKGKQYPSEFRTDSGWVIDLMSYEQSPDEFEGATIGLFIFNEPPPENIFNACMSRLKFGGKALLPMTPLNNSAWIYDRLILSNRKDVSIIYGDTEDNCIEHGVNGVLPHAAIQAFADSCDPDDREARLHGKFMHMAGQIFKTFSRDAHVIKPVSLDNFLSGKQIFQVCDPAIGKPIATVWAAVDALGVITVYDEYPHFEFQGAKDSNLTVRDYADLFKAQEGHFRPNTRILDRHFGNTRRTVGGLTLRQEFDDVGIEFEDSYSIADLSSEVETGILKIKDLLRYNKEQPISNLNRPHFQVFENCNNTIHALERWSRDEKTGKPKDEFKDFADCVRYLAMANPEIEQYRPWEVKRPHYGVGN